MMCHVPIHQIQEKDIYHTHWRTHIPMLLNMIKKEFATENLNTRNASVVDQNVKKKNMLLIYLGNMAVQISSHNACYGKHRRNNVTS